MLLDRVSTTHSFSDLDASEDAYSPAPSGSDWPRRPLAGAQAWVPTSTDKPGAISEGDQVVFARLDVAEALGIWRHALGLVVETHVEAPAAADAMITLDVKFDGHEVLYRYLPDLFEKRAI